MPRVALITIGQSPRVDVTPDIVRRLPAACEAIEAGALDGISVCEIGALAPKHPGETLVTRLADGEPVVIGKSAIVPRLQALLDRLAPEVDAAVVMCTGEFPMLRFARPLIEPDRVLFAAARAVHRDGSLGVLVPMAEQVAWSRERFAPEQGDVVVEVGSPYRSDDDLVAAAERLRSAGCRLVVLNCMGFNDAQAALVRRHSGAAALQPASLIAKFVDEVMA